MKEHDMQISPKMVSDERWMPIGGVPTLIGLPLANVGLRLLVLHKPEDSKRGQAHLRTDPASSDSASVVRNFTLPGPGARRRRPHFTPSSNTDCAQAALSDRQG